MTTMEPNSYTATQHSKLINSSSSIIHSTVCLIIKHAYSVYAIFKPIYSS